MLIGEATVNSIILISPQESERFIDVRGFMTTLPIVESCDHCGACCMQAGHPPYIDDERQWLDFELLALLNAYLATLEDDDIGRPCIWLDLETRRCRHYEHRPQVCRDFQRGSDACRLVRWRYRIGDRR